MVPAKPMRSVPARPYRRRAHGARRRPHAYCQDKLLPRVLEAFRHEKTDPAIFREMGELGLLGPTIPEQYGGAGLNYVCYGLIAREVERVDSGYRSHDERAELAGDGADQRIRHRGAKAEVPAQAGHRRMDRLLRPDRAQPRLRPRQHDHPRQARSPAATAVRRKMWITNSPIADVFVVWAKDDGGQIRGFILEKGMKGLSRPAIHGKVGLRAQHHRRDRDGRGVRAPKKTPSPRCAA
jgi:glutaryl-CoA dehydrogenase